MIYKRGLFSSVLSTARQLLRPFDNDLLRSLFELDDNLGSILDKKLNFEENFDSVYVDFTSHASANTQFTVAHDLGRTPTGYIPVTKDKAADIYNTTAPDKENLFLKCSVSSATIKMLVF